MSTNNHGPLDRLMSLEKDARDFGFFWPNHQMIYEQMISECDEVMAAMKEEEGDARVQEEIGDVIHTALAWCFFAGYDVDETIAKIADKFEERMKAFKAIAKARGLDNVKGKPVSFLFDLWKEAKRQTKK